MIEFHFYRLQHNLNFIIENKNYKNVCMATYGCLNADKHAHLFDQLIGSVYCGILELQTKTKMFSFHLSKHITYLIHVIARALSIVIAA